MSTLQNQVNELRVAIDHVTHQMHIKINRKDYIDLAAMLSERLDLLHRLVAMTELDIDKEALKNYFIELRERDQSLIALIGEERAEVEAQLLNLNKLANYVNPVMRGVY